VIDGPGGTKLFVDKKSLIYLNGTVLDYEPALMGKGCTSSSQRQGQLRLRQFVQRLAQSPADGRRLPVCVLSGSTMAPNRSAHTRPRRQPGGASLPAVRCNPRSWHLDPTMHLRLLPDHSAVQALWHGGPVDVHFCLVRQILTLGRHGDYFAFFGRRARWHRRQDSTTISSAQPAVAPRLLLATRLPPNGLASLERSGISQRCIPYAVWGIRDRLDTPEAEGYAPRSRAILRSWSARPAGRSFDLTKNSRRLRPSARKAPPRTKWRRG